MATYSTEIVRTAEHRWIIPASQPWGARSDEVWKAWGAAQHSYREIHGLEKDAPIAAEAMSFHVTDEAIVISFVTQAPQ